jgi:hypothetical protein
MKGSTYGKEVTNTGKQRCVDIPAGQLYDRAYRIGKSWIGYIRGISDEKQANSIHDDCACRRSLIVSLFLHQPTNGAGRPGHGRERPKDADGWSAA